MWKTIAGAVAMTALPAPALAQPLCLTRADAETVGVALLPAMLESVEGQCRDALPPESVLALRGEARAESYRAAAVAARPEAEAIAGRLIAANADEDLPPEFAEAVGLDMFEAAAASGLAGIMDPDACRTADRVFGVLEPLPATNVAGLLVLLLEIGQKDEADSPAPFRLCEE